MRAIVVREFGSPAVLHLEDMPLADPKSGEVLVRIRAAGVNPVDAYMHSGNYARTPKLPYVPGSDGAGDVEAVGAGVDGFRIGDRVYIARDSFTAAAAGTYAERAICTPGMLHPLPASISYEQGAAIGVPYATAYRALLVRGKARSGETVLVHGATGGVGIAAIELAHAHGLNVLGTGGTPEGLQLVRDRGAAAVFNHRDAGYLDAIMTTTGGRGVDLILEMAAHINLDKDLTLLAREGRVVVIGNRGRIEIDPRQTMSRDASILGMTLFNSPPEELQTIRAALVDGLSKGTLNPAIGRRFPLEDAARAHEAVLGSGAHGKIMLLP